MGTLLDSRTSGAICAMYFTYGYGLYFYFTWLPTYLIRVLGFSTLSGGLLAGLPFVFAGVANLIGGWLTDSSRDARPASGAMRPRLRVVFHGRGADADRRRSSRRRSRKRCCSPSLWVRSISR